MGGRKAWTRFPMGWWRGNADGYALLQVLLQVPWLTSGFGGVGCGGKGVVPKVFGIICPIPKGRARARGVG